MRTFGRLSLLTAMASLALCCSCRGKSSKETKTELRLAKGIIIEMVEVTNGVFASKHEVSEALWQEIMGAAAGQDDNGGLPKANISMLDVKEFIDKLNSRPEVQATDFEFRLPTVKEWRMAFRTQGEQGESVNGQDCEEIIAPSLDNGWFVENSTGTLHAIGGKLANKLNLYDMLGNVWEMTATMVPNDDSLVLCLGGSYTQKAARCSPDFEYWYGVMDSEADVGFRLFASDGVSHLATRGKEKEDGGTIAKKGASTTEFADMSKDPVRKLAKDMIAIPSKKYYLCKYEVTQALWIAVMGSNPSASKSKGADFPVENVSWFDCQDFLDKLNALPEVQKSGFTYRLPKEDEWSYACRAGATGAYCKLGDGTEITEETVGEVAWYAFNSELMLHPVGQKKPNAFGIYDMLGNVWEWTSDPSDDENYAQFCEHQCGGSFEEGKGECNAYSHSYTDKGKCRDDAGFRLAADKRR